MTTVSRSRAVLAGPRRHESHETVRTSSHVYDSGHVAVRTAVPVSSSSHAPNGRRCNSHAVTKRAYPREPAPCVRFGAHATSAASVGHRLESLSAELWGRTAGLETRMTADVERHRLHEQSARQAEEEADRQAQADANTAQTVDCLVAALSGVARTAETAAGESLLAAADEARWRSEAERRNQDHRDFMRRFRARLTSLPGPSGPSMLDRVSAGSCYYERPSYRDPTSSTIGELAGIDDVRSPPPRGGTLTGRYYHSEGAPLPARPDVGLCRSFYASGSVRPSLSPCGLSPSPQRSELSHFAPATGSPRLITTTTGHRYCIRPSPSVPGCDDQ